MSNENDSLITDLLRLIPGYGAYRDQESRRDDDRQTRGFLGKRLNDCKAKIDAFGEQAVASGDIETPARLEKMRGQIDLAQSRLASAVEGYAGWFSDRQVDAKLLSEIATLDANLVSLVDQMDALAKGLAEDLNANLAEISEAVQLLHRRIDRRNEILKNGS